jgi:hypothetical protein
MIIIIYIKEVSVMITLNHFIGSDASSIQFVEMIVYRYHYDWYLHKIAI